MFFRRKYTPHGKNFSFIDKFVLQNNNTGISWKHFDPNLPYYKDHFPKMPLTPGTFLIECAAQCAGAMWPLVNKKIKKSKRTPLYIASIEKFRLHAPVLPNSTVCTTAIIVKDFTRVATFECTLKVQEVVVATGKIIMSSATSNKQI